MWIWATSNRNIKESFFFFTRIEFFIYFIFSPMDIFILIITYPILKDCLHQSLQVVYHKNPWNTWDMALNINQSINHRCVLVSGASQFLVGIGSVVSCVSEAVMFVGVFYVFKHISHTAFMAFGLIGYIFRFCVFASVTNPWLVLPVEIFQGSELLLFTIQLYFHAFILLA